MSHQRKRRPYKSHHRKRGIVLLLVVSLITLFLLIALTYTVVANSYKLTALPQSRLNQLGDNPELEIDQVFRILLRDVKSPDANNPVTRNPLTFHSLLYDFYGVDAVAGVVRTGSNQFAANVAAEVKNPDATGQVLHFSAQASTRPVPYVTGNFSQIADYYNGRVLTFVTGDAKGLSTRVIKYDIENVSGTLYYHFWVVAFDVASDAPSLLSLNAITNQRFIVNGAPFNGTGFGFAQGSAGAPGNLDQTVNIGGATIPVALLPNFSAYVKQAATVPLYGGPDEGVDAPTYQDMLLAMVPAAVNGGPNLPIYPSLHRPDLINYHLANNAGAFGNYDVRRAAIFRPMPWDHPNFTGGNNNLTGAWGPGADGALGTADDVLTNDAALLANLAGTGTLNPWDVDNDGDGKPDSIWIDPGLPLAVAPNGRKYKRLFAIMVRDLDGRLNLNATGNRQIVPETNNPHRRSTPVNTTNFAGSPTTVVYLPRGQGVGPAEIDFSHLVGYDKQAFSRILSARYGGLVGLPGPGIDNGLDPAWFNKYPGLPYYYNDARNTAIFGNGYGSPIDMYGRFGVALDSFGQPLSSSSVTVNTAPTAPYDAVNPYTFTLDTTNSYERGDAPYEMQVDPRRATYDQPFTAAELERLLRFRDADSATLPKRLADVSGTYFTTNGGADRLRNSITTMGTHVPVPATAPIGTLADRSLIYSPNADGVTYAGSQLMGNTIMDLFNGVLNVPAPMKAHQLRKTLAWELRQGGLFNLNRPFGNGVDDDNNGVVDDPGEFLYSYTPAYPPASGQMTNGGEKIAINGNLVPMWHRGDEPVPPPSTPLATYAGTYTPSSADPRQLYCRHLYCLMMMMLPPQFYLGEVGASGPVIYNRDTQQALYARKIAQWCVNVVDFRDPDSINTAFEFDFSPFANNLSGQPGDKNEAWNVDDDISTDEDGSGVTFRDVVWGCERPELLLTESFAFHNRATEDLDAGKKTSDPTMPDDDFDGRIRPSSGAFFELYNPWYSLAPTGGNPVYGKDMKPGELYNANGVELTRMAPPGVAAANGSPVWRMIVVVPDSATEDLTKSQPYDPDYGNNAANPGPEQIDKNRIVRSIYFANPAGLTTIAGGSPNPAPADGWANYPKHGQSVYFSGGLPATATLAPGQYAVVGSSGLPPASGVRTAYTTYIGRLEAPNPANTRRIELDPTAGRQVKVMNNMQSTDDLAAANASSPIAIVINQPRSLSLSEPFSGYPGTFDPPAAGEEDIEGALASPVDTPLDKSRANDELTNWWDLLKLNGPAPNFRRVHLQRLANPLLAWHPVTNPYLTVDTTSVDLHRFNGVASDTDDPEKGGGKPNLQTQQRGGSWVDYQARFGDTTGWNWGANDNQRTLWRQQAPRTAASVPGTPSPDETTAASALGGAAAGPHFYKYPVFHTLGYINSRYQPFITGATPYNGAPLTSDPPPMWPATDPSMAGVQARDVFPWPAFLNRPFTSPAELLLVPATSQAGFTSSFQLGDLSPTRYTNYALPFGQLFLNPYASDDPTGAGGLPPSPKFYRLFDFVEVRSPFADAEKWFNPNATHFLGGPAGGPYAQDGTAADGFRPPFNFLSNFRDFGRVNVNTAVDDAQGNNGILEGVFAQGSTNDSTLKGKVERSLRGVDANPQLTLNSGFPTLFGNPLRASDLATVAPNVSNLRQIRPVDATRFRPDIDTVIAGQPSPLLWRSSASAHEQTTRNPYFGHQPLQATWNKVTGQSNCYAVWITVGYFEAEWVGSATNAYPDGYRLGQEMGVDTNSVDRHKAFYLLDRSIPVAFEPGEDHNVDRCVLIRRFIE